MAAGGKAKLLRSTHNKHKVAFSEQARDVIRISDIVLETLDSRFIQESRISEVEKEVEKKGKMLIHVITKADLLSRDAKSDTSGLSHPIFISSKTKQGYRELRGRIHALATKFKEHPIVHVGVVGYPNTGKSNLINILSRKGSAGVSAHSGFTKGIQKIRFAKGILLIDTPGIIPSTENLFGLDTTKHALLGVHTSENVKNPDLVVHNLMKLYPGMLEKFYGTSEESNGDAELLLEELGKKWGFLRPGGVVDVDRTARKVLKEWQEGKMK